MKKGFQVVIGTDIYFSPELSVALAKVVDRYLLPTGCFYGASSAQRIVILRMPF
jgi:hypothetical protein